MKDREISRGNRPLFAMLFVAVISLAVMAAVLAMTGKRDDGTENFTPPPFEQEAVSGEPEVSENLGYSPLDIPGAYRVSLCGKVVEEGGCADVWFTNHAENTVWMKLRVLDAQGNILGETGLLKPGEYVQSVELTGADVSLEDGMELQLKIMAYEPDTYHSAGSAVLNTTLERQKASDGR